MLQARTQSTSTHRIIGQATPKNSARLCRNAMLLDEAQIRRMDERGRPKGVAADPLARQVA
jgi:hypothetical protein